MGVEVSVEVGVASVVSAEAWTVAWKPWKVVVEEDGRLKKKGNLLL